MNFIEEDFHKYDYWMDYYIEDGWPRTGFRFADMVESYCYEKHILTNELPDKPTFTYWDAKNVTYFLFDEGKVYQH